MKNYEVLGELIKIRSHNPEQSITRFQDKVLKKLGKMSENESRQWDKMLYIYCNALSYIAESEKKKCACGSQYDEPRECPDCGRYCA